VENFLRAMQRLLAALQFRGFSKNWLGEIIGCNLHDEHIEIGTILSFVIFCGGNLRQSPAMVQQTLGIFGLARRRWLLEACEQPFADPAPAPAHPSRAARPTSSRSRDGIGGAVSKVSMGACGPSVLDHRYPTWVLNASAGRTPASHVAGTQRFAGGWPSSWGGPPCRCGSRRSGFAGCAAPSAQRPVVRITARTDRLATIVSEEIGNWTRVRQDEGSSFSTLPQRAGSGTSNRRRIT